MGDARPISYSEFLNLPWAKCLWGRQAPDWPLYRNIFKSLADFGAIVVKEEKKGGCSEQKGGKYNVEKV